MRATSPNRRSTKRSSTSAPADTAGRGKVASHGANGANGVSAGNGARVATASNGAHAAPSHGESIEQCVVRNLDRYFEDLGGASPHALHEMVMRAVERPLLQFALHRTGQNQSAAAELLGINRNTLRKKMQDFGLD